MAILEGAIAARGSLHESLDGFARRSLTVTEERIMGGRSSTTARHMRGDRTSEHSSTKGERVAHQLDAMAHHLSIVHFEDDQDEPVTEVDRGDAEERRLAAHELERLGELIVQRINGRTSGRIRNLVVRCEPDCVTIRGQCATFYTKQLAQHAAMGVIEDETVVNEISVGFSH